MPLAHFCAAAGALTAAAAVLACPAARAQTTTTTFSNATAITIPASGIANPYPSTITVSALTGTISKVTVSLLNYSHAWTDDVDVLLVAPGGQSVALMFGAGDADAGTTASGIDLTFDDDAPSLLPDDGATNLLTGTYKPTNYNPGDVLDAPAPGGPYGALLSALTGTAPNGVWRLYVQDLQAPDGGSIAGGWRLSVTTVTAAAVPEPGTAPLLGAGLFTTAAAATVRRRRRERAA
jgi:subtilisin-like proprotein convertase family protein